MKELEQGWQIDKIVKALCHLFLVDNDEVDTSVDDNYDDLRSFLYQNVNRPVEDFGYSLLMLLTLLEVDPEIRSAKIIDDLVRNHNGDPLQQDSEGNSALSSALMYDKVECFKTLTLNLDCLKISRHIESVFGKGVGLFEMGIASSSWKILSHILTLSLEGLATKLVFGQSLIQGIVGKLEADSNEREGDIVLNTDERVVLDRAIAMSSIHDLAPGVDPDSGKGGNVVCGMIKLKCSDQLRPLLERFETDDNFKHLLNSGGTRNLSDPPLLMAVKDVTASSLKAIDVLLDFGADASITDSRTGETLVSIFINRNYRDVDEAVILNLTRKLFQAGADVFQSADHIASMGSIPLLKVALDFVGTEENKLRLVNFQEHECLKTILHHVLESPRSSTEVEADIRYLLSVGADVGVMARRPNGCYNQLLPIHVATIAQSYYDHHNDPADWQSEKSLSNLKDRIRIFIKCLDEHNVFEKILDDDTRSLKERVFFLKSHLLASTYISDDRLVHKLLSILQSYPDVSRFEAIHFKIRSVEALGPPPQHLPVDAVVDFVQSNPLKVFENPILHWATFHKHEPMMQNVVRAECEVHLINQDLKPKVEKCFASLPRNHELRRHAIDALKQIMNTEEKNRKSACAIAIWAFFTTFGPYVMDFALDIMTITALFNEDRIPEGCMSATVLVLSVLMSWYLVTDATLSSISRHQRDGRIDESCFLKAKNCLINYVKAVVGFPFVYARLVKKNQLDPESAKTLKNLHKMKRIWRNVKYVEIGENVSQLVILVWAMRAHLNEILVEWENPVDNVWDGLGYMIPISSIDAGFPEILSARLFFGVGMVCYFSATMRASKDSSGKCDFQARLCHLVSGCLQASASLMTLTLLLFMDTSHSGLIFATFLITMIILKFLFKVAFENFHPRGIFSWIKTAVMSITNLLIIMPNEIDDDNDIKRTFVSVTAFHVLSMLAHVGAALAVAMSSSCVVPKHLQILYSTVPPALILVSGLVLALYYCCLHPSRRFKALGPTGGRIHISLFNKEKSYFCKVPSCCKSILREEDDLDYDELPQNEDIELQFVSCDSKI